MPDFSQGFLHMLDFSALLLSGLLIKEQNLHLAFWKAADKVYY